MNVRKLATTHDELLTAAGDDASGLGPAWKAGKMGETPKRRAHGVGLVNEPVPRVSGAVVLATGGVDDDHEDEEEIAVGGHDRGINPVQLEVVVGVHVHVGGRRGRFEVDGDTDIPNVARDGRRGGHSGVARGLVFSHDDARIEQGPVLADDRRQDGEYRQRRAAMGHGRGGHVGGILRNNRLRRFWEAKGFLVRVKTNSSGVKSYTNSYF